MNTDAVNKWLSILANAGVLAGIFFLALEVRQSNRIAIATTEMSIWDKYVALNNTVLESEGFAELLVRASDPDAEFTPEEEEKLSAYLYRFANTWYAIEIGYENGTVTKSTFNVIRADVDSFVRDYPGFRPAIGNFLKAFETMEETYVSSEMRRALDEYGP